MKLSQLFNTTNSQEIKGIVANSKEIKKDYLFFLLPGADNLLDDLIGTAVHKKAAAIVTNKDINADILTIKVTDIYAELKRTLDLFYGSPFKDFKLIGVTGTDGKTTTSFFINHILGHLGCGYIGSGGIYMQKSHKKKIADSSFTTPPLTTTYRHAKLLQEKGVKYLTLEASSLGINNHRIDHMRFDYTVFTNLSYENLDTFETIQDYFNSKFALFSKTKEDGIIIVNGDDPFYEHFKIFKNHISFGQKDHNDYRFININQHYGLITFDLITPNGIYYDLYINNQALYNLYNILPGIIIGLNEGIDPMLLFSKITNLPKIDGTTEKIIHLNKGIIYIEYAQTPNAISCALKEIKKVTPNKLVVVCQLSNYHDVIKHPKIGQVISEIADYVVFTTEDELDKDNLSSINQTSINELNFVKIPKRQEALKHAISKLEDGDTLVITSRKPEFAKLLYNDCYIALTQVYSYT